MIVASTANSWTDRSSEAGDASALLVKAERCRRLAAGVNDLQAAEVLRSMAREYEDGARLKG